MERACKQLQHSARYFVGPGFEVVLGFLHWEAQALGKQRRSSPRVVLLVRFNRDVYRFAERNGSCRGTRVSCSWTRVFFRVRNPFFDVATWFEVDGRWLCLLFVNRHDRS